MNSSVSTINDLHASLLSEITYKYLDFRGKTPLKMGMEWGGGDILALSANNVVMGGINKDKEAYYGSESLYLKWMNKGDCERGDILLTMEAPLGNVAQIPDDKKYILSQRVILIKLRKDLVSPDFIFHLFMGDGFQRDLIKHSTGSTVTGIQQKKLDKISIYYPSLNKQEYIAKILTTIDQLIEKTQALIDKHTIIKQGMMADLFTRGIDHTTGQLRPSVELAPHLYKETELGSIPKNWEVDVIDNIVERIIDYRGKTPTKTETGVPLITAKNIRMGYIDPEPREYIAANAYNDWMTRGIPVSGDILFTTEAPLANVAQIQTNDNCAFAQRVIILRCNNRMHNNFLKYSLLSDDLRTRIFIKGSGSTVEGIKQSQFRKIMTSFPTDMKEQLGINDHLKNIESQINSESIYRSKLLKIKSGLMQDLLTGKVRVLANE